MTNRKPAQDIARPHGSLYPITLKPYNAILRPLNTHATPATAPVYPTNTPTATRSDAYMLSIPTLIAPVKRFAYPSNEPYRND